MIDPHNLTQQQGRELYMKYLGCVAALAQAHFEVPEGGEADEMIESAIDDAEKFLAGHIIIRRILRRIDIEPDV